MGSTGAQQLHILLRFQIAKVVFMINLSNVFHQLTFLFLCCATVLLGFLGYVASSDKRFKQFDASVIEVALVVCMVLAIVVGG